MPKKCVRAIILAAGRGSRMGAATGRKPKCLTEFLGYSLLAWQKAALIAGGIEEIAIVDGYCSDQISHLGPRFHNSEWESSNMVSSMFCAKEYLEGSDTIVSYSDIVYQSDIVLELRKTEADLAIAYDPNWLQLWSKRFSDPLCDAESFKMSAEGLLIKIGQTPASLDDIEGQYMGLLKFSPVGWAHTQKYLMALSETERSNLDMTTLLQHLIEEGAAIACVQNSRSWCEVDSVDDLNCYLDLHRSGNLKFADAKKNLHRYSLEGIL